MHKVLVRSHTNLSSDRQSCELRGCKHDQAGNRCRTIAVESLPVPPAAGCPLASRLRPVVVSNDSGEAPPWDWAVKHARWRPESAAASQSGFLCLLA